MTGGPGILIVEDEAPIRQFLRISLEAHGFEVREARLGADGLAACQERAPDLVILDLGLPDMDGMRFISKLREWSDLPIIVLSVRAAENEKVQALDLGANDYVTKPFGVSELLARVRVLLRNRDESFPEIAAFEHGGLLADFKTREVTVDGTPVHLTRKEYDLLHLLITHPGQVLTHEQIIRQVWGAAFTEETHYLRVLMRQLRNKLGEQATSPRFIVTVQGVGYRFDVSG